MKFKLSELTREQLLYLYNELSVVRDDILSQEYNLGDFDQDFLQKAFWLDSLLNVIREALYDRH